jgi:hypothetical protein
MKTFKELTNEAKKKAYPETPRQKKEREAWEKTPAGVHSLRKRKTSSGGGKSYRETPRQKKEREAWEKSHPANEEVETNVSEAWGSTNPKVPFKGEYEVEFAPNSVTGRSSFYVDHDEGDKEGKIYVKTDYKGKGDSNVDERKFIASLKKHLAAARKAGERVNVEVHEIGNMGFKSNRSRNEGTNARQRGEVQSPRSQEEYDALSPEDKKIVDKRTRNAFKQSISRQPGESPRNKRTKKKPRNRNRREK